ncbi:hypothetical protein V8E55_006557 [Tylopilus felleus]
MVIEAVSEQVELKKRVFCGLRETLNEEVIFATNMSSISITKIVGVVVPEGCRLRRRGGVLTRCSYDRVAFLQSGAGDGTFFYYVSSQCACERGGEFGWEKLVELICAV